MFLTALLSMAAFASNPWMPSQSSAFAQQDSHFQSWYAGNPGDTYYKTKVVCFNTCTPQQHAQIYQMYQNS